MSTRRFFSFLLLLLAAIPATPQNPVTGASFGSIVSLGFTPEDIVLDESRGRLYLINSTANRVDIYDYVAKRMVANIAVGTFPLSGAMSMDNDYLYVTNVQSATMSIIKLGEDRVTTSVSLPARPEGVAVGIDGRVLITTQGTGTNNTANTLLLFDPRQEAGAQLITVPSPPTITTPNPLPAVFVGRPATPFPGRLIRTPDGNFIIGMVAINQTTTSATTTLFVFETQSGVVLRNRSVTGQSTVLAISPDGSKFMAGSTLYDTATLNVIGQMNVANFPFFLNGTFSNGFNVQVNYGGSSFSPDGQTLLGAFNNAATGQRVNSNVLVLAHPTNLGGRLGIKLPESVLGKMVITSDGSEAWALSSSGFLSLPLAKLFDYPILMPETQTVFLAIDDCNKGLSRAQLRITNAGKGKLTFAVPNTGAALVAQVSTGVAPATINFVMEPGRAGVTRQAGTNLYTGSATNSGSPVNVVLASNDAVNLPNVIKVFMNFRQSDQRGMVFPVPTGLNQGQGLWDILLDEPRGRLYLSNAGFNRVEVFDIRNQKFLAPIEVGQLPRSMAMSLDGSQLYVANGGGESIQVIDLESRALIDQVQFPPLPRAGNQGVIVPETIAMGTSGLQFIMSNGSFWKLVGNYATLRPTVSIVPATIGGPRYLVASANGETLVAMSGTGVVYQYNAIIDAYSNSRQVYNQTPISYFGPLAAANNNAYFLAGGQILSSSLTPVGGAERPGATQTTPSPIPGQPPIQTIVSAGQRNVAAVVPLNDTQFLRMTTPVRQAITSTTRDDPRTQMEIIDVRNFSESIIAVLPENPVFNVLAANRVNIPARQMVVDSQGTAYSITLSGLSVIPLAARTASTQPRLPLGARAIVNSQDGSTNIRPGSFVTITGQSLASAAAADTLPAPTMLGGSCVTFNDVPLTLIQTSPTQIQAQIPSNVRPGQNVVQVRSLANAQQSEPVVVTVQRVQ